MKANGLTSILVTKNDHDGNALLSYEADVVERGDAWICVRAQFARNDVDLGVVIFHKGDLMTEWFYTDRYYNIFQIHDGTSQTIKGWYCNITRPARITDATVAADDLAMDVFISPSGIITILDEDEFAALNLSEAESQKALDAVNKLVRDAEQGIRPFDSILHSQ